MAGKSKGPVVESLAVLRPVERVWSALTSPRDLGLLVLGRVDARAEPGAPLSLQWGVWEKIAPRRQGGYTWKGRVLDVVPGSTLVLGPDPVVTFTVKGQAHATLLTVVQGVPASGQQAADYEYGWADFLLRLKTHLETEDLPREVWARALVRATPQQVYRAWLNAKALRKILPGKAKLKARVGERFSWQHKRSKHVHSGVFLELKKTRRIAFTWEGTQPASEVVLEAQPMPYGTLVCAHHTGLVALNAGQLFAQRMFWLRLLERLRCYFYFKGKIKATD
ncbi:MAG TPA: SRPBCC family protein [Candidatus Acidoferrales bacterium]|nr:SRPBCC family protein [Candidatus Acidoferrales bacterium]